MGIATREISRKAPRQAVQEEIDLRGITCERPTIST